MGRHTITWTATDKRMLVDTDPQILTITDKTPPTIEAPPKEIEATAEYTWVTREQLGEPTVNDLVDPSPRVYYPSGGSFELGVHDIIWQAIDRYQNIGRGIQKLTMIDASSPVITVLYNTTIWSDQETVRIPPAEVDAVSVTDLHDPSPVVTYKPAVLANDRSHVVTWTATDESGNKASATSTAWVTREQRCDAELSHSRINYGPVDPGQTTRSYRTYMINTGTLPVTAVYINAMDWTPSTASYTLPASATKYMVRYGGAPAEWTGLSGTAEPPSPTRPHRSFDVYFRLSIPADFNYKGTIGQTMTYTPTCMIPGAGGASGQASAPFAVVAGQARQFDSAALVGPALPAADAASPAPPLAGAAPVAGLRIVQNYSDAIAVQWDGQQGASEYKAVLIPDGDVSRRFAAITPATSFTFINLDADTPYEIRVGVRGNDTTQAHAGARTLPAATALPFNTGIVLNATLSPGSPSVVLEWSDDNGMGGDRYRVERSVDGGGSPAPYELTDLGPRQARAVSDAVLEGWSGATVHYRVFEWLDSQRLYSNEAKVRIP